MVGNFSSKIWISGFSHDCRFDKEDSHGSCPVKVMSVRVVMDVLSKQTYTHTPLPFHSDDFLIRYGKIEINT